MEILLYFQAKVSDLVGMFSPVLYFVILTSFRLPAWSSTFLFVAVLPAVSACSPLHFWWSRDVLVFTCLPAALYLALIQPLYSSLKIHFKFIFCQMIDESLCLL